jgi:hypothetical protein
MFESSPVTVWPENRTSVLVFMAMRTQWRYSHGGPAGMDYAALAEVWRRLKVQPSERDSVFVDLQLMESVALSEMHEK